MAIESPVDVAINIFAKPYQTSLSVLSLLKFSGRHIDRVFLQFEPRGSAFDKCPPYIIAEYLGERAAVSQAEHWLEFNATDMSRLGDNAYRLSIRYQHAFENTDKDFLFIMHNDVLILRDIVGAMRENIGDAFAVGELGQCWNCPAKEEALVREAACGGAACTPERYMHFQPDFAGLERLYQAARKNGFLVRPYHLGWEKSYAERAWPLPECRVNEWGCLVSIAKTRPHAMPGGPVPPFGVFEQCGKVNCLDTGVVWFRELNRLGLRARHMQSAPYLKHWIGTGKMTSYKYARAEDNARQILEKHFQPFVCWCRKRGVGLFE